MPKTVHKSSSLTFTIKKGSVHFKQTENYKIGGDGATSKDVFPGDCSLDSDNLHSWLAGVCKSWIDGDSIRDDATIEKEEDDEE